MERLARMLPWAPQNTRNVSSSTKDVLISRSFPTIVIDELRGQKKLYLDKFPGWALQDTIDAGNAGEFSFSGDSGLLTGWFVGGGGTNIYFSDEPPGFSIQTPMYCGNTSTGVGGITHVFHVSEFELGGIYYWAIHVNQRVYLLSENAVAGGVTFTANRTSGNVTLTGVSSFTGLVVGQALSGTGIDSGVPGARIASLNPGAGTLDMTIPATSGAATSTTVTRERMALVINANFPTNPVGPMQELNGRVFIGDWVTNRIHQSALNDPFTYTSGEYVTANQAGDSLAGIAKYRDHIVGIGRRSVEFYYYTDSTSGSQLKLADNLTRYIGAEGGASTFLRGVILCNGDVTAFGGSAGGVYIIDNFSPVLVSDDIGSRNSPSSIDSLWFNGRQVLLVTVGGSTQRLYDINNKLWLPCAFTDTIRCTANSGSPLFGVALSNTAGKRYNILPNSPVWQDDGAAYSQIVRLGNDNFGKQGRKFVSYYELAADNQASGTVTLEVNDNDFDSGSWVTLGTFDLTQNIKQIWGGGSFEGFRAHRLTHSANTANRMQYLDAFGEVA